MKSIAAAAAFGIALTLSARAETPQNQPRTVVYEHSFCSLSARAYTGAIVAEGPELAPDERQALEKALEARGVALRGYFKSISENMNNKDVIQATIGGLSEVLKSAIDEAKPALKPHRGEINITFNVFRDSRHQCREILVMRA